MDTPTTLGVSADLSASLDLTLALRIPTDQLEAMATAYAFMLRRVREAIDMRRAAARRHQATRLELVHTKEAHANLCLAMVRQHRRGASFDAMAHAHRVSLTEAKEMTSTGRRLARNRLAIAKRAYIVALYDSGHGPRPIARMTAARFGRCSPAYAVKITNAHRARNQLRLPMPVMKGV